MHFCSILIFRKNRHTECYHIYQLNWYYLYPIQYASKDGPQHLQQIILLFIFRVMCMVWCHYHLCGAKRYWLILWLWQVAVNHHYVVNKSVAYLLGCPSRGAGHVISRMWYWVELHSIMSYNQHQLRDHLYRYVFIYHVIKCAHYSNISLIFLYNIVHLSVVNINSNSINSKKMYNIHCIQQHQIRLLLGNKNHAMLYQGQKFQNLLLKNI